MIILCIETSTSSCSAAIFKDGMLLANKENLSGANHASELPVFIEQLLAIANTNQWHIDAVALSEGPGSYTGLRIGTSIAKGLCFGMNIPLIPINTLQILCNSINKQSLVGNTNIVLCPMIDARRMEVYTQLFDAEGKVQSDVEAKIIDEESFSAERASGKPFVIFGSGAAKCAEVLKGATLVDIVPSARGMARLAEKAFAEGNTEDVAYFEPFYLKDFVVGTAKKSLLERVMK